MNKDDRELFFYVINNKETLDDILIALLEIGVDGCTVIDSKGMGGIIKGELPIFAGFADMFKAAEPNNEILISVMKKSLVSKAVRIIEDVNSNFDPQPAGIIFTTSISFLKKVGAT